MKRFRESFLPPLTVSFLLGLLGLSLSRFFGLDDPASKTIAALMLLVSLVVLLAIYRPVRRFLAVHFAEAEIRENGSDTGVQAFRSRLASTLGLPSQNKLHEATGVVGWYGSFRDLEPRLAEMLKQARTVRILTNTGKSDIGKGTRVRAALAKNSQVELRVLLASPESPYITKSWALSHGFSEKQAETWTHRVQDSLLELGSLKDQHSVRVVARMHSLPFVWRLWIVDQTAFVSAWLERTESSESVRVFELQATKSGEPNRLFEMFSAYFDRIWNEQSDETKWD